MKKRINKKRSTAIARLIYKYFEDALKSRWIDYGEIEWLYEFEELSLEDLDSVLYIVDYHEEFFYEKFEGTEIFISDFLLCCLQVFYPRLADDASIKRKKIYREFRLELLKNTGLSTI